MTNFMSEKKISSILKIFTMLFIVSIAFFSCQRKDPSQIISHITFRFHHSLRIPYSEIIIDFYKRQNATEIEIISKSAIDSPQWDYSKIDTSFNINVKTFDDLAKDVVQLLSMDLVKPFTLNDGLDGTTCEIEFGNNDNTVTYKFWTPNFETEQRGLSVFLELCEKILKIGGFNSEKILLD